jgi:hypothetical protein
MMFRMTDPDGFEFAYKIPNKPTAPSGESCPPNEEISAFILGLSESDEIENKIIDHVRVCKRCETLVDTVSKAIENCE